MIRFASAFILFGNSRTRATCTLRAVRLACWFIVVLVALVLGSCLPTSTDPGDDAPIPPVAEATVAGFVYRSGSSLSIVDRAESAPAGSVPAQGARISASDLQGVSLGQQTLDETGRFSLRLRPGYVRLDVSDLQGTASPATHHVTAVAGTEVAVGATGAVDREDAIAGALASVGGVSANAASDGWLIVATLQPLPAGVAIASYGSRETGTLATTASSEWLVFVDPVPEANWSHDVHYVRVDASTGTARRVEASTPPVLNGAVHWLDGFDLFTYGDWPTGNDLDPIPQDLTLVPGPEVVQLPDLGVSAAAPSVPPAAVEFSGSAEEDVFALLVRGGAEDAFVADMVNMYDWLLVQGVPPQNIQLTTFVGRPYAQGLAEWNTDRGAVFDAMEKRLEAGGQPTLLYYVAAHAFKSKGTGDPYGDVEVKSSDGSQSFGAGNLRLDLAAKTACRLVVIWECCFAEVLAENTLAEMAGLVGGERPDLKVFAACRRLQESYSYRQYHDFFSGGSYPIGGLFTNAWIANVSIANGDIAGYLGPGGIPVTAIRDLETYSGGLQNPVRFHEPGFPDHCMPPPLVTLDQETLQYARGNSGVCPGDIGTVRVRNESDQTVAWSALSEGPLAADPPSGTLAPNAAQDVLVQFTCTDFGDGVETLEFRASAGDIETVTRLAVDLDFTVTAGSGNRDFDVRFPNPLATVEISLYFLIPDGAQVDSSRIVNLATGEEPPPAPWAPLSPITWSVVEGFRPGFRTQYGIEISIPNTTPFDCEVCAPQTWNYTLWYSFPGR